MAYLIKTDGSREEIDDGISIPEMEELIGAICVEFVWPKATPSRMFICDDMGACKNLPLNKEGGILYGKDCIHGDIIVFESAVAQRKFV